MCDAAVSRPRCFRSGRQTSSHSFYHFFCGLSLPRVGGALPARLPGESLPEPPRDRLSDDIPLGLPFEHRAVHLPDHLRRDTCVALRSQLLGDRLIMPWA